MGQAGKDRQDKPLPLGPFGALCGCPGGTGHSSDTAQLLNPSKAVRILHGQCQDGASRGAQAGNNDGMDSGDSQAHASARTFPSIHGVVISSLFVLAAIPNIPSGHVLLWMEIPLLGWERVVLGLTGTS